MESNELLKMISKGFEKTPYQVVLSVAIIVLLLSLFFTVSKMYFLYINLKIARARNSEFERLIRFHDLTINELDFINELSGYLFDSGNKVILLKNKNTFLKASGLWKRDLKSESPYTGEILRKVFNNGNIAEKIDISESYGKDRPVRFISGDGDVFSGRIESRTIDKIILTDVVKRDWTSDRDRGMVFIQDFKGVLCQKAGSAVFAGGKMEISLEKEIGKQINLPSIESVYMFHKNFSEPVKTRMKLLNGNLAYIGNVDKQLEIGDTLKISLRKSIRDIFHVNATVLGLSVNRTTAKIRFGHIDESVKLVPKRGG